MNFYIFRHGETYFSQNDLGYGEYVESAEILPIGIPAIQRLGKYLENITTDFNVSSPYLRCRQTIEIIEKQSGKKFEFDNLIHDIDYRNEDVNDMVDRMEKFYNNLIIKNYKSVAICSHGYPIAVLKSLITTGKTDLSKLYDYPHTGVLIEIKNKVVTSINFNETMRS